ncbi:hypothetical protein FPANT_12740 [Fusarium pseudoanthophilum]|uniref:Uncharacterized protein n=1 Tax=Fusarium pseudoanthophilum TaxID=48495 RepID=A0A8H5KI51_9HYPO|nr:hypothetical protein FPANT_12740 [Fusarium pseudoanthophilum]
MSTEEWLDRVMLIEQAVAKCRGDVAQAQSAQNEEEMRLIITTMCHDIIGIIGRPQVERSLRAWSEVYPEYEGSKLIEKTSIYRHLVSAQPHIQSVMLMSCVIEADTWNFILASIGSRDGGSEPGGETSGCPLPTTYPSGLCRQHQPISSEIHISLTTKPPKNTTRWLLFPFHDFPDNPKQPFRVAAGSSSNHFIRRRHSRVARLSYSPE